MGFQGILSKIREKNRRYEELKVEDEALHKLQERKLSAEERSLNKIMEKKRQENIKVALAKHYKKEEKDYWKKDIITQPNIFKHKTTILKQKRLFKK